MQDNVLVVPKLGLYAIADGMGGHTGGAECSEKIIEIIEAIAKNVLLPKYDVEAAVDIRNEAVLLHTIVSRINARLIEEGDNKASPLFNAGSTCTVIRFFPMQRQYAVAHVGDSRVTRYRKLHALKNDRDFNVYERQLTKDHGQGNILDNCMGRALSNRESFHIDAFTGDYKDGDLFILSTDGLHDYLHVKSHVDRYMLNEHSLHSLQDNLTKACEKHSEDNYSFVLIQT